MQTPRNTPNRVNFRRVSKQFLQGLQYSRAAESARSQVQDYAAARAKALGNKAGPINQKKSKMPVQNQLVTKSTMKVKGKSRIKRRKTVKVSSKLRAAIKQVNAGDQAKGTYRRVVTGMVGYVGTTVADATYSHNADLLGTTSAGVYGPSVTWGAGYRTLWSSLSYQAIGAASAGLAGRELNFFTLGKVMHAASCLFNGKQDDTNPYTPNGNLSTEFINSTGAPTAGFGSSLKINVLNSWVKFEIKNVSQRVVEMDIWECTPKLKFENTPILNQLFNAFADHSDGFGGINARVVSYTDAQTKGAANPSGNILLEGSVDPVALFSQMGFQYNFKKRTMILGPGETCVHTIQGFKGVIDYAKTRTTDPTGAIVQQIGLMKGMSVACLIGVRGDQVGKVSNTNVSYGAREQFIGGTGWMSMPVAINFVENYRIAVPEIAGFVTPPGPITGGTKTMLNYRKDRFHVYNIGPSLGSAQAYSVSNEENPLFSVVNSQQT